MEDGACCDRVSAGGSRRRAGSRLFLGVPGRRPLGSPPSAPPPPLWGSEGCPPHGPAAGPERQTPGGWDPPRVGRREEAPRAPADGPPAAGLSGRPPARRCRLGWALPFALLLSGTGTPAGTPCGVSAHPRCSGGECVWGSPLRVPWGAAGRGPGAGTGRSPFSVSPARSSRRRRGTPGLPRPRTGSARTKAFAPLVRS